MVMESAVNAEQSERWLSEFLERAPIGIYYECGDEDYVVVKESGGEEIWRCRLAKKTPRHKGQLYLDRLAVQFVGFASTALSETPMFVMLTRCLEAGVSVESACKLAELVMELVERYGDKILEDLEKAAFAVTDIQEDLEEL